MTNRQLEKRLSALENAGATMKTTSIVARLREENARLRTENDRLRAELQAIKNPGGAAGVQSTRIMQAPDATPDLCRGEAGGAGA